MRRARMAAIAVGAGALAVAAALGLAAARPAIRIELPRPEQRVGVDGIELLARFEDARGVEPATVRVLLNGADVTRDCVRGRNGVHARLYGLLDGVNRVRVEAFARAPWPAGLLVQQAREVRVLFRPPAGFDRG